MQKYGVNITYLYNSGFKVETKNHVLIFDYWQGNIGENDLRTNKKVIVLSSHSHGDHFNDVILSWMEINPDIKYILSSDIEVDVNNCNINKLSAYEELTVGEVYIKAYGSTDIGVSFLVKVDGINIFHAGDLNWWHWKGDPEDENERAEHWFIEEVLKLKGEKIDIAFFPVDPRLEENYDLGAEYFIYEIKPKLFVPMHFRENHGVTKKFSDKNREADTTVLEICKDGEELLV
jgi:L-ascorbate metabolism protein UlaG (beta-lactamase superfamily)